MKNRISFKNIVFYLCMLMLSSVHAQQPDQQPLSVIMGNLYLQSALQKEDQTLLNSLNLYIRNETLFQAKKEQKPFLDYNDYKQLNIFGGKQNDTQTINFLHHHLSKHIPLQMGKTNLALALGEQKTAQELKNRQEILQELSRNNQLTQTIKTSFEHIKTIESDILALYSQKSNPLVLENPIGQMFQGTQKIRSITQHWLGLTLFSDLLSLAFDQSGLSISYNIIQHFISNFLNSFSDTFAAAGNIFSNLPIKQIALPLATLISSQRFAQFLTERFFKKRMIEKIDEIKKYLAQQPTTITHPDAETAYLIFNQQSDAQACFDIIKAHFSSQFEIFHDEKAISIKFCAQEKNKLKASHPLLKHETLITIAPYLVSGIMLMYLASGALGSFPLASLSTLNQAELVQKLNALDLTQLMTMLEHFFTHQFVPLTQTLIQTAPFTFCLGVTNMWIASTYVLGNLYTGAMTLKRTLLDTTAQKEKALKITDAFAKLQKEFDSLQKQILLNPILKKHVSTLASALSPAQMLNQNLEKLSLLYAQAQHLKKEDVEKLKNNLEKHQELKAILQKLVATLQNATLSSQPSYAITRFLKKIKTRFFSNDAVAAYHQILEVKDYFIPGLCAIGELSMYVGLTDLMKEYEAKDLTFSFPTYEEGQKPHFKATNLWLAQLLDYKTPIISHSIELGNTQANTALISGVNQGGKTSLLRAISTATLMARTLSFVPAQACSLTLPEAMFISFNATDDLGQKVLGDRNKGSSGFGNEINALNKSVQAIKSGKHCFIFIDELCGKANGGDFFSYELIKQNLLGHKNTLIFITSLFEQPKLLGAPHYLGLSNELKDSCALYQFAHGYSYRFEPGAWIDQHFQPRTVNTIEQNPLWKPNLDYLIEVGLLKRDQCLQHA